MKKLIILLLIVLSASETKAQVTQLGGKNSYVEVLGGLFADSTFRIPLVYPSTFTTKDSAGRMWLDPTSKILMYHNGTARVPVSGGGGTSYALSIDTSNFAPATQDTIRTLLVGVGDSYYSEFGTMNVPSYTAGSPLITIAYTDVTGTVRTTRIGYRLNGTSQLVYLAAITSVGDYTLQPIEFTAQAGTLIYLYTSAITTLVCAPRIRFQKR